MSDYISRQAAVSFAISGMVRTLPTNDGSENWIRTSEVRKSILSIPAADVVPVVRCKDCKHHAYDEIFSCYWCEYPGRVRDTTPDGFCEKGEE